MKETIGSVLHATIFELDSEAHGITPRFALRGNGKKAAMAPVETGRTVLSSPCLTEGQEVVVVGFMPGTHGVDALLIGFYRGRELHFCASVRAGFVPASRFALYSRLEPFIISRCPFVNVAEQSPGRWGQGLTAEKMEKCLWDHLKMVVRRAAVPA